MRAPPVPGRIENPDGVGAYPHAEVSKYEGWILAAAFDDERMPRVAGRSRVGIRRRRRERRLRRQRRRRRGSGRAHGEGLGRKPAEAVATRGQGAPAERRHVDAHLRAVTVADEVAFPLGPADARQELARGGQRETLESPVVAESVLGEQQHQILIEVHRRRRARQVVLVPEIAELGRSLGHRDRRRTVETPRLLRQDPEAGRGLPGPEAGHRHAARHARRRRAPRAAQNDQPDGGAEMRGAPPMTPPRIHVLREYRLRAKVAVNPAESTRLRRSPRTARDYALHEVARPAYKGARMSWNCASTPHIGPATRVDLIGDDGR